MGPGRQKAGRSKPPGGMTTPWRQVASGGPLSSVIVRPGGIGWAGKAPNLIVPTPLPFRTIRSGPQQSQHGGSVLVVLVDELVVVVVDVLVFVDEATIGATHTESTSLSTLLVDPVHTPARAKSAVKRASARMTQGATWAGAFAWHTSFASAFLPAATRLVAEQDPESGVSPTICATQASMIGATVVEVGRQLPFLANTASRFAEARARHSGSTEPPSRAARAWQRSSARMSRPEALRFAAVHRFGSGLLT